MEKIVPNREKIEGEFIPQADDDMIICRCEEITKGEIRQAIYHGMLTMNEIKRYLRPGMGLCQGLTCTRLVKDILARELKVRATLLEESTPRSPARPVTLQVFADERE
ncbi:MAG: (2Fe-2S)-binding protein [Anaerostipes sp.]|nr:(2Fe-2S)-binding protein [Anaerostipes sp.]